MENKRDKKIDFLRFIAIICIIIAHSGPPMMLFQIRNFDVVLMIMLMGMSFCLSSKNEKYFTYIVKRFKRLLLSTWIFLTLFFTLFLIISLLFKDSYYFDLNDILLSYLTIDGIGYVWIMGVFFIMAILNPIILRISNKIKNNNIYFFVLLITYSIYLLLLIIYQNLSGIMDNLFEFFILRGYGYSLIAAVGIRINRLNKKEIAILCGTFFILFMLLLFINDFDSINNYKYPPTLYYMSYGLCVSLLLYQAMSVNCVINFFDNKFVDFISKNSITIYFWHIISIYILEILNFDFLNYSFLGNFLFNLVFSLIGTTIQKFIKTKFLNSKERKFMIKQ